MIFRYQTYERGGKTYIVESVLVSATEQPSKPFECTRPFIQDLRDKHGKFQWTIRENPDYNPQTDSVDNRYIIEKDPIQLTNEELKAEHQQKVRQQLQGELTDLILSNKDDPEGLAQALCDRAKQLEKEMP